MNYQFERQNPVTDHIIFVLTLDRKKMKERILIGEEIEIRSRLHGNEDANIFFDQTRPLGTLITAFEHDEDHKWTTNAIMPLYNAMHENRFKQPGLEQTASFFLQEEWDSQDPIKQYAAFRIWNEYLKARLIRDRKSAREDFLAKVTSLTLAFHTQKPLDFDTSTGKPLRFDLTNRIMPRIPSGALRLDLWYPDQRLETECVAAYSSFYPVLIYYMNRISDWGLHFCKCKVCGKTFLEKSLRYELCSAKCKKVQAKQNKREYDERARENHYDLLYKNECQNWRNKINKAKKDPSFSPERMKEIETAFTEFKAEALRRKKQVKQKETSPQEYESWLFGQSHIIQNLVDILN